MSESGYASFSSASTGVPMSAMRTNLETLLVNNTFSDTNMNVRGIDIDGLTLSSWCPKLDHHEREEGKEHEKCQYPMICLFTVEIIKLDPWFVKLTNEIRLSWNEKWNNWSQFSSFFSNLLDLGLNASFLVFSNQVLSILYLELWISDLLLCAFRSFFFAPLKFTYKCTRLENH